MAIEPSCLDIFKKEAAEYQPLKEKVKEWIESRYEPAKTVQVGVYGLKHWFNKEIGYVTHGALTVWLDEWGYRVHPWGHAKNLEGTYNHCVYIKKRKSVT